MAAVLFGAENPEAMTRARQAYQYAQSGDLDRAAATMREAIQLAPSNPLFYSALGGILARQNKPAEARQAFEQAVKLDPSNAVLRFNLAAKQAEAFQFEQARENLLRVLEAQPDHPQAFALLENVSLEFGAVLARGRRYKGGQTLARETVRRFPQSGPAHEMLGLFETRNQENVLAVEAYKRALELSPDSRGASIGLAIAQSAAGLTDAAIATFEAGIRRFPEDAMHRQSLGVLLVRLGETREDVRARGIQLLESALRLDPRLPEAHYQLGNLALTRAAVDEAVEHLEQAVRNGEDSSRVHFALSRAYRRLGKPEKADAELALFRRRKAAEEKAAP
ncbi:MAG: tetratricopeptide repeat protein [Bryobacteraceae bacterium]